MKFSRCTDTRSGSERFPELPGAPLTKSLPERLTDEFAHGPAGRLGSHALNQGDRPVKQAASVVFRNTAVVKNCLQ